MTSDHTDLVESALAALKDQACGIHLHDTATAEKACTEGARAIESLQSQIRRLQGEVEQAKADLAESVDGSTWDNLCVELNETKDKVDSLQSQLSEAKELLERRTRAMNRAGALAGQKASHDLIRQTLADGFSRTKPTPAIEAVDRRALDKALAAYATDEDRYLAGKGEPYGSIPTEVGIVAREARKRVEQSEPTPATEKADV